LDKILSKLEDDSDSEPPSPLPPIPDSNEAYKSEDVKTIQKGMFYFDSSIDDSSMNFEVLESHQADRQNLNHFIPIAHQFSLARNQDPSRNFIILYYHLNQNHQPISFFPAFLGGVTG
jgi:hypothetical protein